MDEVENTRARARAQRACVRACETDLCTGIRAAGERRPAKERKVAVLVEPRGRWRWWLAMVPMVVAQTEKEEEVGRGS